MINLLRKINPITHLINAMNTTDRWVERMSYAGRHWAPAS